MLSASPTQASCNSSNHEMASLLEEFVNELKNLPELEAKRAISVAANVHSQNVDKNTDLNELYAAPGDDCAAFKTAEGYQLLAMEGMLPKFVETDPRAAGWSSVMVNVSDIAAMGGRPTAIVNAFWHHDKEASETLLYHIQRACKVFGLSFAGGHSSINAQYQANLAVGIMGYAKKLLSCHHLKPGQRLFMLSDLTGSWHGDLPYWGCVRGKSEQQIKEQWLIPAELAERELVVAAKDISNGGILGTLIMMLELTGCGAEVDINAVQKPQEGTLLRWFRAFQSFGFLLAVDPEKVSELLLYFQKSHLTCAPIGTINDTGKIDLSTTGAQTEFWDIRKDPLTHMGEKS